MNKSNTIGTRLLLRFLLPMVFFLVDPSVYAAEVEITSSSYLQFREDARNNRYAPLHEYFQVESRNMREGTVSFHSAGWLGYDFRALTDPDITDRKRERDELTYAFLRYSPYKDRSLLLDIGRQIIFQGVAADQIDGVSVRWEITPRTGIAFFGGTPVEATFDGKRSDSIYGGRLYQRIQDRAEVGLSFVKETTIREEVGLDLWLLPLKGVEVMGHSFYNGLTERWMEHVYNLRTFPMERLTLSGIVAHVRYDDAFSARTLNAFSPDSLGKNEKLNKVGASAEYRFSNDLTGVADCTNYNYSTMGSANYYGARILAKLYEISAGVSLYRMDGDTQKLRYLETRFYAVRRFSAVELALDAINLHYDNPFSGISDAYSISGTLRYKLTKALIAGLKVDYSKTPDFNHSTTAFLSLVYSFRGRI